MDIKSFSPLSLLAGLGFAVIVLLVLSPVPDDVFAPVAVGSFLAGAGVWELIRRIRQKPTTGSQVVESQAGKGGE
ncbi:hypothetical protein [Novosphingobium sp.]|uniref:hypothetical protein n=1 Tax=Novosphingobium sp. TaxID=1874826 RepID=UPI0038BD0B3F